MNGSEIELIYSFSILTRKSRGVYDENIEIINGSPFLDKHEMLRSLG